MHQYIPMKKLEIEDVVSTITFEEWDEDEVFSEQEIVDALLYDDTIPNVREILPKDYKWYMAKYGERIIDIRNVSFLTQYDKNTYIVISFLGLVDPVAVYQQYRYLTCTGSYDYRLEEISDDESVLNIKFLPISLESAFGDVLLMDIKDKIGSIWHIPDKSYCEKYNIKCKEPYFVADSFTDFLKLHINDSSYDEGLLARGFKQVGGKGTGIWKRT